MRNDEKPEALKAIMAMFAAWPNTQAKDETYKVYLRLLEDLPLNVFNAAIGQAMAGSEFPPTIAKIRDIALKLVMPVRMEASEAWGVVRSEMRNVGMYHSPRFEDPLIAKLVEILGWRTLCMSENEVADRAHFIKLYDTLVAREVADARLLPSSLQQMQLAAARRQEITDGRREAGNADGVDNAGTRSLARIDRGDRNNQRDSVREMLRNGS